MFEAMERGELRALFVIGENPAQSEADVDARRCTCSRASTTSSCWTSSSPRPPSWPTSCCPARRRGARPTERSPTPSAACSACARRSTRPARRATTSEILLDVAARLGHDWHYGHATRTSGTSCAACRRCTPACRTQRLEELGGIQWPCYSEDRLEPSYLHGRLWADDPADRGRLAPFSVVIDDPPVDDARPRVPAAPHHRSPARLVQHRRAVGRLPQPQLRSARRSTCRRRTPTRSASRTARSCRSARARGTIEAPVRIDPGLRPGLVFMTMHFPDEVDVNMLTIDATDPKSRHRRVQGDRGPHRQARPRAARPLSRRRLDDAASDRSDGPEGRPASRPTTSGPPSTSVLGPAPETAHGGARDPADHVLARGGSALSEQRHLLLPTLHAVNDRVGWISPGAIDYIAERLDVSPAEIYGVASFYALFSLDRATAAPGPRVRRPRLPRRRRAGRARPARRRARRRRASALCERAPAALVIEAGDPPPRAVRARDAGRGASHRRRCVAGRRGAGDRRRAAGPTTTVARAPAPCRSGRPDEPRRLPRRRRLRGAPPGVRRSDPTEVIREVTDSGLVGRGGAAFPTGRKWEAVARQPARPHYLVCNADESEPGTFKDRVLIEGDPFALIESMTIAGFATGCAHGWVYLRGEYPRALDTLEAALVAARARGYLGDDILGSGFAFDITIVPRRRRLHLRRGDGDLQLDRGLPRRAAQQATVPGRGRPVRQADGRQQRRDARQRCRSWPAAVPTFAALGTDGSKGRKLFCVSGAVARPGVYEVEFGVTLARADRPGRRRARRRRAAGGAARRRGRRVRRSRRARPAADDGGRAGRRHTLGSGVVMVLDDTVDLVDQLRRIAAFFRDESCGQCVPCRVGTVRQEEVLARLAASRARATSSCSASSAQVMRDASICGLGQTAPSAIESAIDRLGVFR